MKAPLALMLVIAAALTSTSVATAATGLTALTSMDVAVEFQQAGLVAKDPRRLRRSEFGFAPILTREATRFLIPSLGPDSGGRIFVFKNLADLKRTKAYYATLGNESAVLRSWLFVNRARLVLVQINGTLHGTKAQRYREVVNGL